VSERAFVAVPTAFIALRVVLVERRDPSGACTLSCHSRMSAHITVAGTTTGTPAGTATGITAGIAAGTDLGIASGIDLDAPLPAEIAGGSHGWFTRYCRFPAFSRPWARGRARRLGLVVLGGTAITLLIVALASDEVRPWGGMLQVLVGMALPLFAGPWLGSLIRRRHWAARKEMGAMLTLMLALMLTVAAFNEWGAEPLKQRIAEWTGAVDEQGRRKRVALMIGIAVRPVDGTAAAAPPPADAKDTEQPGAPPAGGIDAVSAFFIALLTFALAGGFALPRLAREREGLAALARERELSRAQAARHEAEMRLSVLAAQVEPHFLFNTLAGVRSAIATDPVRASELVDRLADYLRASIPRLRSDGAAEATLGSQLDIVRAYLGLMATRMPRLTFGIEAPCELLDAAFPPLMLISLAENAVKHGAEPKVGPVRIEVKAQSLADGRLQVSVSDDGAGFGASESGSSSGGGLGLVNIRERLAQMHGTLAGLELRSRAEGGVRASITVPMEKS
jgi:signal transduction histidine kinase